EILNVGSRGIWILVRNQEFFMDYQNFPWFREAKLSDILDVSLCKDHLHWENLA
ncbi:MAG TPA: DUF2442 domain-containing protein, partial [Deltaproteobacteria bacterium]|nr:DUF2442 domain-containing protein [Deltaproteobacteria bacterium]